MNNIILLSGKIGSGKSTAAAGFENRDVAVISTSRCLKARYGSSSGTREALKSAGDQNHDWLLDEIRDIKTSGSTTIVVDAVRSVGQIQAIRKVFHQPHYLVTHVHLVCDSSTAFARVEARNRPGDDSASVQTAIWAEGESEAEITQSADMKLDSSRLAPSDISTILQALVDTGNRHGRLVDVIVGGQYGSEGKGHVMARMAHEYDVLCRVGGPNAGHSVICPITGKKISFYHIPSGAIHSNALLLIGPGAVINPEVLFKELKEAQSLGHNLYERLLIDPKAVVINENHIAEEAGFVKAIGSTGQGVGTATIDKLRRAGTDIQARNCPKLFEYIADTREKLEGYLSRGSRVMMEGTQGTGLSLHHGHFPYVTTRDTAASGTLGEMGIPPSRVDRVFMVCRTNPIRVQSPPGGTSGPMGRETDWETVSTRAGIPADELRAKEMTTTTKRQRRVAEFDYAQLRRASLLNGPTDIALTFVDYISIKNRNVSRFDALTEETHRFIENIELVSGAPVSMISTGFTINSVIDRRVRR